MTLKLIVKHRLKKMKTYLDEIIPFGKHKGKTFAEVIEDDLKYSIWFAENVREPIGGKMYETLETLELL